MSLEISEIRIVPVKPREGLVGFASCVVNGQIYLGGIGIHSDLKNGGFRLVFPAKSLSNGTTIPICHPITKKAGDSLQKAIAEAWERLMASAENVVSYGLLQEQTQAR